MRIKFFTIVQLRRELEVRRTTATTALLMFLCILLLGLACFWVHEGMKQYLAHNLPVFPLLFTAIVIWLGVGIPRQVRLIRDREWNDFVRQMPLGPTQLLAAHTFSGLLPTVGFGLLLLFVIDGMGKELLTFEAGPRWLVIVMAAIWVISLQVFVAIVISRLRWGQCALAIGLVVWVLAFAGRIAWWALASNETLTALDICSTDPILIACGMVSLIRALLSANDVAWRAALMASVHLACIVVIITAIAWRLVSLPVFPNLRTSFAVFFTRPLCHAGARLMPGPIGAEVCIEWLRTLRGTSAYITLYTMVSVILAVLLKTYYQGNDDYMAILVLISFAMANDGTLEIIRLRKSNRLYDTYGVDARDYLLGFITSVGTLIALMCIVQIPVFSGTNPNWRLIILICSTCMATAVSVVPIAVSVDYFFAHLKAGSLGRLLKMAKAGFMVLVVPVVLLLLGSFHVAIPLFIASLFVYAEARRTRRTAVRKLYWRL